ncbi:MAG: MFS transporter [Candidatus Rokuibacteriota bacterium]
MPFGATSTGSGASAGSSGSPLPRTVWALGWVSFCSDVASEMIYPLLPLFLTRTLGAPMKAVGLIEGTAEATSSGLRLAAGWLSDRMGRRKPFVVAGYACAAAAKPLLALAGTWGHVLGIRFLDRFGKGLRTPPRDALLADAAPGPIRGRAFGLHGSMDTAGAVVGPLLAWALLPALGGDFRALFLLSFVPALIGIVVLLVGVPEIPMRAEAPFTLPSPPPGERMKVRGAPPGELGGRFWRFVPVLVCFGIGNSSDAFLILRSRHLGIGEGWIPLLYLTFNVVYAAVSLPGGMLSDRVGRRRVIPLGYAVFAGVYLGFARADRAWEAWPLFALYGIYYALTERLQRAFVADLVPAAARGRAFGIYHAVVGALALPASLLAGWLWDAAGPAAPFWLGGASAALALLLFLLLRP